MPIRMPVVVPEVEPVVATAVAEDEQVEMQAVDSPALSGGQGPEQEPPGFYAPVCWSLSWRKRLLDMLVALVALAAALIPGAIIYLLVRACSPGAGFFRQKRVGYAGRLFTVYKFRTMEVSWNGHGPGLTREEDPRVTTIGKVLRRLKLDELPQFYNVLRGEMSLVGPRPKLPQYAAATDAFYRPGITGLATLLFRGEEELLRNVAPEHLDAFYEMRIKPLKARVDARYMRKATLLSDAGILFGTVFASLIPSLRLVRKTNGKPRVLDGQYAVRNVEPQAEKAEIAMATD